MSYNAYITRIKNIRKHINADRLNVGECFGNSVIISLDVKENELGIYFPTDGKLGMEFCEINNLLREKDEDGNQIGGYLEPEKRHVSTLKLRGEKSDGLFMPLKCLESFCDITTLKEGDMITTLNGILICEKYIPKGKVRIQGVSKEKNKKISSESYPLFKEHSDTAQLAYNTHQFKKGDLCYITLKMHGTSQRSSYTIKERKRKTPHLIYKLLKFMNVNISPKRNWDNVTGTRRVIIKDYDKGFYGSNEFRKQYHDLFANRLRKGETVYYEVVGYTDKNQTIMPECDNKKIRDKEFIKQYGKTTKFTYGCDIGKNDIYVYRMTMTNEDGDIVEYPWYLVKLRCEQMGIKYCPQLDSFTFTDIEDLMNRVEKFVDGSDPIGKTHIREGVVVRIDNKEKFTAYKHKNFTFKLLEGIIKESDILDMEESESENKNE
ncbi:RNA ligase family protein [Clostridium rectalis]|uniref:RNA ligase family protein n=1 Tax=Clostridium rectalis TaxID=2040295 RepID=UPI000F635A61|nr:RNA ligase family protein [Clostridium rectalis]